jgi:hypothetical protein
MLMPRSFPAPAHPRESLFNISVWAFLRQAEAGPRAFAGQKAETYGKVWRLIAKPHRPPIRTPAIGMHIMTDPSAHGPKRRPIGTGGWIAILAMGVLLGAAIWFLFYGWTLTDAQIDTNGYIALVLGVLLSTVLGGGLMALLFWSNRKGYDR